MTFVSSGGPALKRLAASIGALKSTGAAVAVRDVASILVIVCDILPQIHGVWSDAIRTFLL